MVAVVTSSALTGIARVQQNNVWGNAVAFTVASGSNLTLGPNLINMAVGDTQATPGVRLQFNAVPLPSGTVLWSNPGDGSRVGWTVPAVPSTSGLADVFALQNDGTVQAIRSDGITAWTLAVPPPRQLMESRLDICEYYAGLSGRLDRLRLAREWRERLNHEG